MAPQCPKRDAGNSDKPKRSWTVLPASEKSKYNKIHKEKKKRRPHPDHFYYSILLKLLLVLVIVVHLLLCLVHKLNLVTDMCVCMGETQCVY